MILCPVARRRLRGAGPGSARPRPGQRGGGTEHAHVDKIDRWAGEVRAVADAGLSVYRATRARSPVKHATGSDACYRTAMI